MAYTYPGVYIEELPSPVHAIAGVATSIAAFVGYTGRGIDNRAQSVFSFGDYERLYGGLASDSELSYAVAQFFQNGGTQAYVVRVPRHGATAADVVFHALTFTALSSGTWADGQLLLDADIANLDLGTTTGDPKAFNLTITNLADGTTESFPAVTLDSSRRNYVVMVVNDPDNGSQLVNVADAGGAAAPFPITGLVGTALRISDVNTAIGGAAAGVTATDDFGVSITTTSPAAAAPLPVTVKVFAKGGAIPQSVAGLAAQLQSALNAALAVSLPNASVVCSVSPPVGGSGEAIRINATLPNRPDAVIALAAPGGTSPPHDATAALGFSAPSSSNVAHYALGTGNAYGSQTGSTKGTDGSSLPTDADLVGDPLQFTGLSALEKVDLFNLLSIPDATRAAPGSTTTQDSKVNPVLVYSAAITLCRRRRAFLLVDPPPYVVSVAGAIDWISTKLGITDPNGAALFPRIRVPDPLDHGNLRTFAPSGVVAGVYATTDGARGVWKAPAGIQATLNGVQGLTYPLTDPENGQLNPLGLNCLRTFPIYGRVVWGARTLAGADAMASQWKYVPVRRMALFLEESLFRGTKWAVFEPNDEPLWASIRLNVGSFMQTYFLKGAFQGQTPAEAYFVKCDGETTTQTDIDNGVVNILVGFAPLQPAEFVVIQIEQLTGQG